MKYDVMNYDVMKYDVMKYVVMKSSWKMTSWNMRSWNLRSWNMASWNMTSWNMPSWNNFPTCFLNLDDFLFAYTIRRSEKSKNPKSFLSHSDFCAVGHEWPNKKNKIEIRVQEPCLKLTYIIQKKFLKIQGKIIKIRFLLFVTCQTSFLNSNVG